MAQQQNSRLAETKLRPPTLPSQLVQRARLTEILDAAISPQVRLVLASAPAGSGKSTLLASWLDSRPEAIAWLQLEQSDSDRHDSGCTSSKRWAKPAPTWLTV